MLFVSLSTVMCFSLQGEMPPKREILLYAGMTRLQRSFYTLLQDGSLRDTLTEMNIDGAKEISQVMSHLTHYAS